MANILYDRMKETARWSGLKHKVEQPTRDEVDAAIKSARLIDWQKFHEAMDLLEMSDILKVDTLLKQAIER